MFAIYEIFPKINSCEQSQYVTLLDPLVATNKGRLRSLRMKDSLEVTQKVKKISSPKIKNSKLLCQSINCALKIVDKIKCLNTIIKTYVFCPKVSST